MRFPIKLLCLLAALLLALPGQQAFAAARTVAVFMSGDVAYFDQIRESFENAMKADGFTARNNVDIIVQRPNPDTMAWRNTARKLVSLNVDAIMAIGGSAAHIASEETGTIPIIYTATYGPIDMGLTSPNVTGISGDVSIPSLLQTVQQSVKISKLAVLYSRKEIATILEAKAVKSLEGSMGFTANYYNTDDKAIIQQIEDVDAILVTSCCTAVFCADLVFTRARELKIPTISLVGGVAERGAVFTYVPDAGEQGEKAAAMVKQILSGTKPSAVPPVRPEKVNLVINLKEANTLGIKIPFDILTAATEVIK